MPLVNGCNEPQLFIHVVLPAITPALATVGLITFIGAWNNLIAPLIVLKVSAQFAALPRWHCVRCRALLPWGAICLGASLDHLPFILLLALTARWILMGTLTRTPKCDTSTMATNDKARPLPRQQTAPGCSGLGNDLIRSGAAPPPCIWRRPACRNRVEREQNRSSYS